MIKRNKSILRQVLSEKGMSDYFIYPYVEEDFSDMFWQSFRGFDFESFFKGDTYLGDLGIMDTARISDAVDRSSRDYFIPLVLLSAVCAEHWLRLADS